MNLQVVILLDSCRGLQSLPIYPFLTFNVVVELAIIITLVVTQ
jgi:hypothetical protein